MDRNDLIRVKIKALWALKEKKAWPRDPEVATEVMAQYIGALSKVATKELPALLDYFFSEYTTGMPQPAEIAQLWTKVSKYFHTDFNASQIPAIKEKYGRDVTIRLCHEEGGITVESNRQDLTVEYLMAEFGLELVPDYIARHDKAEISTRAGKMPEPQPPINVKSQYV